MRLKTYWVTWFALLVVTAGMLFAGGGGKPGGILLGLLLAAMTVKATLIAGNFMHLRSEARSLVLIVSLGLALVGIALFAGIAPDALRIAKAHRPH